MVPLLHSHPLANLYNPPSNMFIRRVLTSNNIGGFLTTMWSSSDAHGHVAVEKGPLSNDAEFRFIMVS